MDPRTNWNQRRRLREENGTEGYGNDRPDTRRYGRPWQDQQGQPADFEPGHQGGGPRFEGYDPERGSHDTGPQGWRGQGPRYDERYDERYRGYGQYGRDAESPRWDGDGYAQRAQGRYGLRSSNPYATQGSSGYEQDSRESYGRPRFFEREDIGSSSSYGSDWGPSAGQGSFGQGRSQQGWMGPHRGRGPKGYSRSDDRIREDVCDRLADDDRIDASEIEVSVERGEVVLSGCVEDRGTKHAVENLIADSVSGVKDVRNELRCSNGEQSDQSETSGKTQDEGSKSQRRQPTVAGAGSQKR